MSLTRGPPGVLIRVFPRRKSLRELFKHGLIRASGRIQRRELLGVDDTGLFLKKRFDGLIFFSDSVPFSLFFIMRRKPHKKSLY